MSNRYDYVVVPHIILFVCVFSYVDGLVCQVSWALESDDVMAFIEAWTSSKSRSIFLHRLLQIICILCFELMVLGGVVRAKDAGLACPDWPMCFGVWLPRMNMGIFLEWFHRLSALNMGVFLLIFLIGLLKNKDLYVLLRGSLCLVILAFLAQCVLGGLTVLKLLNPGVVSMHLLNALIFYGLLLQALFKMQMFLDKKNHVYALDVLLVKSPLAKNPLYLKHSMYGLGLCVLVQIVWGSMVSSQHAGVACPDFPLCHGHVFLPLSFPWLVWLHYLHRWFGYGIVWIVLFFRYFSVTHRRGPDFLVQLLNVILILLCLQIILGIFNVFYAVPAFLSVLHLANAILIFTLVIWGAFRLDSSMHKRILHLVSKAN